MTTTKPKQQTFDDDPWRLSSTPPNTNIFPVYEETMDNNKNDANTNKPNVNKYSETQTSDNDATTVVTATIPSRRVTVDVVTDKASTQVLVKSSTESYQWFLDLDVITVSEAEKEGFLFTHVNYWVHSTQRQTSVRRRYSDFYWFWENLLKRYPFRVIPNLPPKKISGSKEGNANCKIKERNSRFYRR